MFPEGNLFIYLSGIFVLLGIFRYNIFVQSNGISQTTVFLDVLLLKIHEERNYLCLLI